jgi:hypothetical protein
VKNNSLNLGRQASAKNPTLRSGDDQRGQACQHPRDAGDLRAVRNAAIVAFGLDRTQKIKDQAP